VHEERHEQREFAGFSISFEGISAEGVDNEPIADLQPG
jgi:hypothetical protein